MAGPVNALVIRAPGTNCEQETSFALEKAGAKSHIQHVWRLVEHPESLEKMKILVIPGGFSYGDDILAGRLFANELKIRLKDQLTKFVKSGKMVLGICNGFQVLTSMGFLPDAETKKEEETALMPNDSGRYEDRWVRLAFNAQCPTPFKLDEVITLPVAHGEGKVAFPSPDILNKVIKNNHIVAQYVGIDGKHVGYPANPNGSVKDIAALCNKKGNVIGLMPHPERYITHFQHPQWTRLNLKKKEPDGLRLFQRLVDYTRRHV